MPTSGPLAVTFDAGDTLLYCDPPPPVIYAEHLALYGPRVTADQVAPVFAEAWQEMHLRIPPGRDRYGSVPGGERAWWGAFLREVLTRLDHPAPWRPLLDDLYRAFAQADVWHAFPDALMALDRLESRGLRLAVISNWDSRLPDILAELGMARFFSVVTVSSMEGVEKPSPEIFWRTLDRLGVASERAIHVGDNPHDDYRGAERAGLTPVLLDREGLFTQPPFRRISSLEGLVELT